MIKKNLMFIAVLSLILSTSLFAGMPINQEALPKNALSFIKKSFPKTTIAYAGKDKNEFEVSLSDGTEISFTIDGEWKDVKGYSPLPTGFIPPNIMDAVKKSYPRASVIEIEKKYNHYEIKLDNMMEIYINTTGVIIKQKFDD